MLFYQAVDLNMDAVGMPPAANNIGQEFQQHQAQLNEQGGAFDLKMNFHEKAEANGKYDMAKNGIPGARDDTPSSTDSSVHGLPVVLEERKSRWGLRKTRKDSTKEKR